MGVVKNYLNRKNRCIFYFFAFKKMIIKTNRNIPFQDTIISYVEIHIYFFIYWRDEIYIFKVKAIVSVLTRSFICMLNDNEKLIYIIPSRSEPDRYRV